ncbi:MAG: hypothetical protein M3151_04290 [Actinomycetota bacterium]|nr:hypothetical protein [Actinomycetota bacterium]
MIRVDVEVSAGEARFRMAVRAESINRAINIIEKRHPGRNVRVVFPIDPEEFFVDGPQEMGAGQDDSGGLRPLNDPVLRVR